jgi:hypothetical protein
MYSISNLFVPRNYQEEAPALLFLAAPTPLIPVAPAQHHCKKKDSPNWKGGGWKGVVLGGRGTEEGGGAGWSGAVGR